MSPANNFRLNNSISKLPNLIMTSHYTYIQIKLTNNVLHLPTILMTSFY